MNKPQNQIASIDSYAMPLASFVYAGPPSAIAFLASIASSCGNYEFCTQDIEGTGGQEL